MKGWWDMAEMMRPVGITICMGSSCFSRGNGRNIEVIQEFIEGRDLSVELKGHLCEGLCKLGPNILIDGKLYHEMDPVTIVSLLQHHLGQRGGVTK